MTDSRQDLPSRRGLARFAGRPPMSPLVVLGISLVATGLVTAYVWASAESRDRLRFEGQVQQAVTALDRRLSAYEDILIGGAALFAASDEVSAAEFTRYVESLRMQDRYPGVQGVGFSARVPLDARDSLVLAQRQAGFPDFRPWPEAEGEEFHAVVHLVPQDERNREAMGYDMFSHPVRREAMERARDTGRPAASGRVILVQEIDEEVQPGFLIYVPLYHGPGIPSTVAERRERLRGFVFSPFRAGDLGEGLFRGDAPVDLHVYDGPRDDPESLLFDSGNVGGEVDHVHRDARHRALMQMSPGGRPWTVAVTSGPAFEASSDWKLAPLVLVLGMLASGALSFVTASETRARAREQDAARALRVSEAQYRVAFEANPHPMWVYDTETLAFLAVNEAAVRHYGYSREEFLAMDIRDVRPREEVSKLEAHLEAGIGEADGPGLWRHVTRGGSEILVEISSNALDFGGRPARIVLAHDVTEKVRSREELEETQRRLERILSMSTAVIYTLEVRGEELVATWLTDNLLRVTGYTVEEGLRPGWWSGCIHPDEKEAIAATGKELLDQGQRTVEYRFRHADGHYIWIRDDAVLRRDASGSPAEVIGAWLDVTERRGLEEQFQQAQKMEAVGRLAGGIAHDFNNLLTVIRSQSDLLLLDLPAGPVSEEVRLIQAAADRAATLTSQLLAFSRDQVLRPQVMDPVRRIRDLGQLLDRLLGEDIAIVYDLPEEVPAIEVDPGPFEQAIMNLGLNARDAMPRGGTLTFSIREEQVGAGDGEVMGGLRPGRFSVLCVSDTGTGMDPEVRRRIFEPFFTTKPKEKGTGLGLAMVYGFIRQSQGGVRVESEPGRGSTFFLYFPAVEARAPRPAPALPALPETSRMSGRVLLVEDDASVRKATRKILERSGMTVVDVETAEAGIEALADGSRFDLALTDLVLPGMSGRELVDRARKGQPGLPLIVMSGYEEASSAPRTELPADVAFVRKPFTVEGLLSVVRDALRN